MKISAELLQYLELRGIRGAEQQQRFLFPKLSDHYDPLLLKEMDAAVEKLTRAIKRRYKILIWGDADLDGITAAAIIKSALEDLGAKDINLYIPPRDSDGFGLSKDKLVEFRESGGDMVVTVDVGVTNVAEAELAKKLGLELVITDHHELLGELPDATLVNPKRTDNFYPFRELAGAGVVLKVASALYARIVGLSVEELAGLRSHYWMFAALGTVSDRCPLMDENRLIVREGLRRLRSGGWRSLEIWIEEMGLDAKSLTVFDLYSRGISPFYAAHPEEMVKLLLSSDEEQIRSRYGELKELANAWQRGKQFMIDTAERAVRHIGGMVVSISHYIDPDYLGTVAHSLRERYDKPAIVVVPRRDTWRAECRGLEGADLLRHLSQFSRMFDSFGGHRKACGFTLKPDTLEEFLLLLGGNPIPVSSTEETQVDPIFELPLSADFKEWTLLAPFGEGNPHPRLLAHRVMMEETSAGYLADGIPVYVPLSMRPFPQSHAGVDLLYTVNADGTIRALGVSSTT